MTHPVMFYDSSMLLLLLQGVSVWQRLTTERLPVGEQGEVVFIIGG
jgi:hypothetical protein